MKTKREEGDVNMVTLTVRINHDLIKANPQAAAVVAKQEVERLIKEVAAK